MAEIAEMGDVDLQQQREARSRRLREASPDGVLSHEVRQAVERADQAARDERVRAAVMSTEAVVSQLVRIGAVDEGVVDRVARGYPDLDVTTIGEFVHKQREEITVALTADRTGDYTALAELVRTPNSHPFGALG